MRPLIARKFKGDIVVDLVDYYPAYKDWYLGSETETQDWVVDNVREDWICYEVGSHIGYYAIVMSYLARKGHVTAFEASQQTVQMMKRNIEHNKKRMNTNFSNLTIVNTAVGNFDGKDTEEKLWLTGVGGGTGETYGKFDFITIDTYIRQTGLDKLDFLMVDADGWDYDVLLGSRYAMTDLRPYVILEANYALTWRGHTIEDVKQLMYETNYYWKWLDQECPGNILAIPKEKL